MLALIVFLFILGILIFIHEAGHFTTAKIAGIKVEEFAFGFPPRLLSWKRGETRYAINLLPFGGYVKLLGEDGKESKDPRSFSLQPAWVKVIVILAGVIVNLIFAVLVLWVGFSIGMAPIVSDPAQLGGNQSSELVITGVAAKSPAELAGLKTADIVVGYNKTEDFQSFTKSHVGEKIDVTIRRGSETSVKIIQLSAQTEAPLGVSIYQLTKVKLPIFRAFKAAVIETGKTISFSAQFLVNFFNRLFIHAQVAEGVSGPVGIYQITSQTVQLGFSYVLQLLAELSISLALFNFLPIPPLDGGGVLFVILEKAIKKPKVLETIKGVIYMVGFVFIIGLLLITTYKDIIHLR